MYSISDLAQKIIKYLPSFDIELLKRSYDFAERTHRGQWRKNGDPYIIHPLLVADILAGLQLDLISICSGLLHDVLEDTNVRSQHLLATFRDQPDIISLVEGLTKLNKLDYSSQEEYQAENIRKMMVAMAKDIRIIFIKLADRLHNMRTLSALPEDKIKKTADETLEIFAPLAHRLGMYQIKAELEDLSFFYKMPDEYKKLQNAVSEKIATGEIHMQNIISRLEKELKKENIQAEISGRPKHLYSIYKKMHRQKKTIDEIYDIIAIRVIVNTIQECYQVLGIVNKIWPPIPNTYDNYIALPKPNMYQALHIAVMGEGGQPFEIQIKTEQMHKIAEYGIAAHWRYKEGKKDDELDKKLSWIRELLDLHKGKLNKENFIHDFKINVYEENVFVFTPKGKIIQLPAGSTPVDFAYHIHTEVGNHCVGAKVQNKIVPLDYQLKNGEKVEILTRENAKPSLGWLSFVRSSHAKAKIRQWFKKQKREENIKEGKSILEKEIKKAGLEQNKFFDGKNLQEISRKFNFRNTDALFAAVGCGDLTPLSVLNKWDEFSKRKTFPDVKPSVSRRPDLKNIIIVEGLTGCDVKISRCCLPIRGDEICGYITKRKGIVIHKNSCPEMLARKQDKKITPDRFVKVIWNPDERITQPITLKILAQDRIGLLNEITSVIKEMETNISSVRVETKDNKKVVIKLTLDISSSKRLSNILQKIKLLKSIEHVEEMVVAK